MENTVYQRVVDVLVETTGVAAGQVEPDTRLDGLDLDSLALLEVGLALHKEFGVEIDDSEVARAQTVVDLAELVDAAQVTAA